MPIATGAHVRADRFEGDAPNRFAIITHAAATGIEPRILDPGYGE